MLWNVLSSAIVSTLHKLKIPHGHIKRSLCRLPCSDRLSGYSVLICTAKKSLAVLEKAKAFNYSIEPLGLIEKMYHIQYFFQLHCFVWWRFIITSMEEKTLIPGRGHCLCGVRTSPCACLNVLPSHLRGVRVSCSGVCTSSSSEWMWV